MELDMKTQLAETSKMIKLQQTVERQLFSMLMNNTTNSDTHSHQGFRSLFPSMALRFLLAKNGAN